MDFKIGPIKDAQALRVWAPTKDIPEATKALLTECLKEAITVSIVTFDYSEDEWSITAWGD